MGILDSVLKVFVGDKSKKDIKEIIQKRYKRNPA